MHLIIPVGGQSSRYPNLRPKWMLSHPNGNLMLAESIHDWDLSQVEDIYIICLRKHDDQYNVRNMMKKQFGKLGWADKLQVVVIEESQSQPDTVHQGIRQANIDGPIFIKDSDNYFSYTPMPGNIVCFSLLAEIKHGKPANKSYILMSESGTVLNIVEKRIISDTFCTGGYGFASAQEFASTFEKIRDVPNLYVSHVIYQMILDGIPFAGAKVGKFEDWGTLKDWDEYRSQFCTLFIDLDGVLVENSAEYFSPFWGETDAIRENVAMTNKLYESGQGEIIITTTRTPESEPATVRQLERIGLKYHRILFGLQHSRRIIVNDYSTSNPYPSCEAINIQRNSNQLTAMLSNLVNISGEGNR